MRTWRLPTDTTSPSAPLLSKLQFPRTEPFAARCDARDDLAARRAMHHNTRAPCSLRAGIDGFRCAKTPAAPKRRPLMPGENGPCKRPNPYI